MRKIVAVLANPTFEPGEELIRYRHDLSLNPNTKISYKATMGWVKERGGLYYEDAQVSAIKNRTLIVNGKNDVVIPLHYAYKFLELMKNSHGFLIPNCGHWAMMEYPELFVGVTTAFLEKKELGRRNLWL